MRLAAAATATVCFVLALLAYAAWPEGDSRPVPWTDLTTETGPLTITRETKRVFGDRRSLARYLAGTGGRVPPVDFSRRQVLLVAPGPRSSTGYRMEVKGVTERGGELTVTVRERTPQVRERTQAHVTFPYRLVSLPANRDVYVEWPGR